MIRTASGFVCVIVATVVAIVGCSRESSDPASESEPVMVVEASCGQCSFELPGDRCDLAVRIDGEAYFVDGSHIDDHGDAHAADGLCNSIRQANATGRIVDGRFVASSFALLPE